ncbi:TPA: hypothetical protein N0F65_011253 [Lagenidium giganteum]|uniref:Uncharacterized protein n=1 Tax=Lagenidium giganteum TaxID=4803 RepID=A0AAV2Z057_9STRA|nr:TPA: hypothetical protein N0F65_011253 [Lagenidium giganteum]
MERALQVLENIVAENSHDSSHLRRQELLQANEADKTNTLDVHARQQSEQIKELQATLQLLAFELEKERAKHTSHGDGVDAGTGDQVLIGRSKNDESRQASTASAAIRSSPRRPCGRRAQLLVRPYANCIKETGSHELCEALGQSATLRMRAKALQDAVPKNAKNSRDVDVAVARDGLAAEAAIITSREGRIRQTLDEYAHWKHEYKRMRDQVVEEKMHQVELFRRLEAVKVENQRENEKLELALREADMENRLLRSQLAEARTQDLHQKEHMDMLVRQAKEEKEKLVCCIAETRHKFKEWKEGEAATLKAARDQAVHNLRTEYELKIARHHEEKQKLRDKVKDLEVSLRLLQKDRNLSPSELSQRKATILRGKDGSTTEAELIEAQCRIKELESLLEHMRDYQKRQENIIKVSESTISRLVQEREVAALENLTLQHLQSFPTVPLALSSVESASASSPPTTPMSISVPLAAATTSTKDLGGKSVLVSAHSNGNVTRPPNGPGHAVAASRDSSEAPPGKRRTSVAKSVDSVGSASTTASMTGLAVSASSPPPLDPEKEILRRQSLALSAEVEKYRQIVVHSLDEIMTLKDSRRRSQQGVLAMKPQNPGSNTTQENFLVSELARLHRDIEEMKASTRKKTKKKRGGSATSDSESDSSSNSDDSDDDRRKGSLKSARSTPTPPPSKPPMTAPTSDQPSEPPSQLEPLQSVGNGEKDPVLGAPATAVSLTPPNSIANPSSSESDAIKVIQRRSKTYLMRKDFVKKRAAIDKIKAQYRGYQVRKNMEILDPFSRKRFVVTQAMQIKMEVVQSHLNLERKCHGRDLALSIRVSKDPPIIQIQIRAQSQGGPQPVCVRYFHLFEIIALLSSDKEAQILEQNDERNIANLLAEALLVTQVGSEYQVMIAPKNRNVTDAEQIAQQSIMLAHLPVARVDTRDDGDDLEQAVMGSRIEAFGSAARADPRFPSPREHISIEDDGLEMLIQDRLEQS